MDLKFYKPNAKTTGAAATFSFNDGSFYVQTVHQKSWDPSAKKGTFFNGKDKDHSTHMKFTIFEAGEMLDAIETYREATFFHSFGENKTQISLTPWAQTRNAGKPSETTNRDFGFSATVNGSKKFRFSLYGGEVQVLKAFLMKFLLSAFTASEYKRRDTAEISEAVEEAPVVSE